MNIEILSYRDLVFPLTCELEILVKHFSGNDKYTELLNALDSYISIHDEFPYQKELLKSLNLKRAELVGLMNDLYQDFLDLMSEKEAYAIQNTEIQFILTCEDQVWIVGPEKLKIIPRMGETVYLPTLTRNHRGASYFKVEEIIHEISGGKHVMEIHMT